MGTVRNLNPAKGLEEFCNFLYGEEEGFIHLPLKNPETGEYEYNFFFKWPAERQEVIDHVERHANSSEVFITPGMFNTRSANVVDSHGSYVAWADFDGNVPSLDELQELDIPVPTLRVQSSVPGREHWYWRYDQFNTDIASVQGINQAICYALNGDIGAWDAGHSLRPVGSINHKRGDVPVVIKAHNANAYRIEDFASVPVPQASYNVEQFKREQIPSFVRVLMKYGPWESEAQDLFTKVHMKEGTRSSALAKLAYFGCEQGLDNSEVFSLLRWKDKHWKKFVNRSNAERYYVDLINFARQKVPYEGIKDVPVLTDEIKTLGFLDVLNYVDTTQWLIKDILPYKGTMYLVGSPGTGKTTLGIGLSCSLALNRNYLDWASTEGKEYKVLYLSLEMPFEDVNQFFKSMSNVFSEEEQQTLQKNFQTYASPEKIKFYQPANPILSKFLRKLENYRPDIILVDSASYSLASNLSSQEEVTKSNELLDMIKDKYGVTIIFIHHARKDLPGHGYREADLDDVFGSAFIAASASSIVGLKKSKSYSNETPLMDVRYLKSRFTGDNTGFSVIMDGDTRMFKRPTMGELIASAPVPKQPEEKKRSKSNESFFKI
jgi:RecA-family ATPase